MDLPQEYTELIIIIIAVSIGMALVGYFTKSSKNFRVSRNTKARKNL